MESAHSRCGEIAGGDKLQYASASTGKHITSAARVVGDLALSLNSGPIRSSTLGPSMRTRLSLSVSVVRRG
jgi:hypothetical protein